MDPKDKKKLLRGVLFMLLGVVCIWLSMRSWGGEETAPPVPDEQQDDVICVQVITPAKNPETGEVVDYPTPCDVPRGWEVVQPEVVE